MAAHRFGDALPKGSQRLPNLQGSAVPALRRSRRRSAMIFKGSAGGARSSSLMLKVLLTRSVPPPKPLRSIFPHPPNLPRVRSQGSSFARNAPSGQSTVHSETASQRAVGSGIPAARRPISAQTARPENLASAARPYRRAQNFGQLRATADARDPDIAIRSHPILGEVRNDGSRSCRELRGCRRHDPLTVQP
jgi:hypothetical protein